MCSFWFMRCHLFLRNINISLKQIMQYICKKRTLCYGHFNCGFFVPTYRHRKVVIETQQKKCACCCCMHFFIVAFHFVVTVNLNRHHRIKQRRTFDFFFPSFIGIFNFKSIDCILMRPFCNFQTDECFFCLVRLLLLLLLLCLSPPSFYRSETDFFVHIMKTVNLCTASTFLLFWA